MKLVRCHIENFGGLSDIDFSFEDGLTVLYQPNGFGKSTLAAFIKAMLYGFPRTAKRSLSENDRKKYLPWQGGKYGGFLIFSYQGINYRVSRYFGTTAARDTFSLYDITNRRESKKFSSALGEELFQLDSDSYARSTYMPQLQGNVSYSSTEIQAKLSNLVEDTNDINNFDSAMERLKKKRGAYQSYRGDGGRVGELQKEISTLRDSLDSANEWQKQLNQSTEELDARQQERDHLQQTLNLLQDKISIQSTRAAERSKWEQYEILQKNVENLQKQLHILDLQYPNGYPTQEQAELFCRAADQFKVADEQIRQAPELSQEQNLLQQETPYFATDRDIDEEIQQGRGLCTKLSELNAKLGQDALTPEEAEEFARLQTRFQSGVPASDVLDEQIRQAGELSAKHTRCASMQLSSRDASDLQDLHTFFHGTPPSEPELDAYDDAEREITRLTADLATQKLPEQDADRLKNLRVMFAASIPTAEKIACCQEKCRKIDELEGKKNAQTTLTSQVEESSDKKSPVPLLCAGGGVVLVVLGIIGLALSQAALGGVGLGLGIILLAAAIWINTRQMISHSQTATITTSAIRDEELQDLYNLKRQVSEFLLSYYQDSSQPQSKLAQLSADCDTYRQLTQREEQLSVQKAETQKQLDVQYQTVTTVFQRYYGGKPYQPGCGADLRKKVTRYQLLSQQAQEQERQRKVLQEEVDALTDTLKRFLAAYAPDSQPEQYSQVLIDLRSSSRRFLDLKKRQTAIQAVHDASVGELENLKAQLDTLLARYKAAQEGLDYAACLDNLNRRWQAFRHARKQVETQKETLAKLTQAKGEAEQMLHAFVTQYALIEDALQVAQHLNADLRDQRRLSTECREAKEKLHAFEEQNPHLSEKPVLDEADDLPDVETLQKSQQHIRSEMDESDRRLSTLRDSRARLQQQLEQLPAWQDQLEQDQAELQEVTEKSDLLDATMHFLTRARERLSTNYVGRVEQSFLRYANTLLGDGYGTLTLDHDLNIVLENDGVVHGLEYFSPGAIDSMMLCMHLALVDTLFGEETPCLILDDPFVNLDDEHTQRALSILTTLAKTHQILYLVCNSSRCIESSVVS